MTLAPVWPFSNRDGAGNSPVSDAEHEQLWSDSADGLVVGQPASAFGLSLSGSSWGTSAGVLRAKGHGMTVPAAVNQPLGGPSSSGTRLDLICAFLDQSNGSAWTVGVHVHPGAAGSGLAPAPTRTATLWEVPLWVVSTASSGATAVVADLRQSLLPAQYAGLVPSTVDGQLVWDATANVFTVGDGSAAHVVYEDTGWVACPTVGGSPGTYWTGPARVRRDNGRAVWLDGYQTRQAGAYPAGAAGGSTLNFTIPDGFRPSAAVSQCVWCDSGAGWLLINPDGTVVLRAIAADMGVGYSAHFTVQFPLSSPLVRKYNPPG